MCWNEKQKHVLFFLNIFPAVLYVLCSLVFFVIFFFYYRMYTFVQTFLYQAANLNIHYIYSVLLITFVLMLLCIRDMFIFLLWKLCCAVGNSYKKKKKKKCFLFTQLVKSKMAVGYIKTKIFKSVNHSLFLLFVKHFVQRSSLPWKQKKNIQENSQQKNK